jgi:hypothetical protein
MGECSIQWPHGAGRSNRLNSRRGAGYCRASVPGQMSVPRSSDRTSFGLPPPQDFLKCRHPSRPQTVAPESLADRFAIALKSSFRLEPFKREAD